MKWHSPGEFMSKIYKQGGIHWDAKQAWIDEALSRGGKGGIMCKEGCTVYETYEFGAYACQDCEEAWRQLPNGKKEYWHER